MEISTEPFINSKSKQKRTVPKIIAALFVAILMAGGCYYYAKIYLFIAGDPDSLIESYHQSVVDGKYVTAYNLLSEANRKMYTKDEFALYLTLNSSYIKSKDFRALIANEYKNKVLDDNKFVKVMEYNVTETLIMADDNNNTKKAYYKLYAVADSGRWRIYRLQEDLKHSISNQYTSIGYMYQTGKGKIKDIGMAENLFKKAISYDIDNPLPYSCLGFLYFQSERFDNAIIMFEKNILKDGDKQHKSDAYSMLAFCYVGKHDNKTALECFELALQLNPENQNIKKWMADLEQ